MQHLSRRLSRRRRNTQKPPNEPLLWPALSENQDSTKLLGTSEAKKPLQPSLRPAREASVCSSQTTTQIITQSQNHASTGLLPHTPSSEGLAPLSTSLVSELGQAKPGISKISAPNLASRASTGIASSSGCPDAPISASSTNEVRFIAVPLTADGPPPWDRSVEVVWTRHNLPTRDVYDEIAFGETREAIISRRYPPKDARFKEPGGQERSLDQPTHIEDSPGTSCNGLPLRKSQIRLPSYVRFRIMDHLLASHSQGNKPIRMNHPVFLREVWPEDYFESLENVLSSLDIYVSVCRDMRADVLATLFLTRNFHVVYTPHVSPRLHMAATRYMELYGPLMSSIILEVDFTKLGGGWRPEAADLNPWHGLNRIKKLVERFVETQLELIRKKPIQHLQILVRRYYGVRLAREALNAKTAKPSKTKPLNLTATVAAPTPQHQVFTHLLPLSPVHDTAAPPTEYTPSHHISHALFPLQHLLPKLAILTITGAHASFITELISPLTSPDPNSRAPEKLLPEHPTVGPEQVDERPEPTAFKATDPLLIPHPELAEQPAATDQPDLLAADPPGILTYRTPGTAYPLLLPGQSAIVDFGPHRVTGSESERVTGLRVVVGPRSLADGAEGVQDSGETPRAGAVGATASGVGVGAVRGMREEGQFGGGGGGTWRRLAMRSGARWWWGFGGGEGR